MLRISSASLNRLRSVHSRLRAMLHALSQLRRGAFKRERPAEVEEEVEVKLPEFSYRSKPLISALA